MRVKKTAETDEDCLQNNQNFPSARYFQVHFQYLHEIISDLRNQIDLANRQITELQERLRLRPVPARNLNQNQAGDDQDAA